MRTRPRTRRPAPGTRHARPSQMPKLGRCQTCVPTPTPLTHPSRVLPPRAFLPRLQTLKLRLQQTALGERGEWLDCFEMKDVELPPNAYFGISSATGDLVDNHDIMQFTVGSLEGVVDPIAHHESWVNAQDAQERAVLEEFDLRPAEATQRDYSRVLRAQASAIKSLTADVNKLKQSMEFQLASLRVYEVGPSRRSHHLLPLRLRRLLWLLAAPKALALAALAALAALERLQSGPSCHAIACHAAKFRRVGLAHRRPRQHQEQRRREERRPARGRAEARAG